MFFIKGLFFIFQNDFSKTPKQILAIWRILCSGTQTGRIEPFRAQCIRAFLYIKFDNIGIEFWVKLDAPGCIAYREGMMGITVIRGQYK